MSYRILKNPALAAMAVLTGTMTASASKITVNKGDLILSFYQVNTNNPPGVEQNTYSYNLGPAATWRENTSPSSGIIENINADLEEAFGADWFDNDRVIWSVVSVGMEGGAATVNGDPQRTTYYSQALNELGNRAAMPDFSLSSTRRGSLSTQLGTYYTVFGTLPADTAGSSPRGAIIPSSTSNNYSAFVPPTQTTYFNISLSPNTTFGPGNLGVVNGYTVEAAVDVFRTLHTLTGADGLPADTSVGLTAGASVVGVGQYVGTFTIDSAGNIRMDATVAPVAAATGYEAWADANGLTGPERAFDADPDSDTLSNGVEFVVGGNPKLPTDSTKQPQMVLTQTAFSFVFRRTDASAYLSPAVEIDGDLVGTWTLAENGVAGVTVTVDDDFYGAGVDKVTVSVPNTSRAQFARLHVISR